MVEAVDWVPGFVVDKLAEHDKVEDASVVGPRVVRVERKNMRVVNVACVAVDELDRTDLDELLGDVGKVDAVINVGAKRKYTGRAKRRATDLGVGLYTMGELLGALRKPEFTGYEAKPNEYAKRVLASHSQVDRIDDEGGGRLRLVREDLGDVTLLVAEIYTVNVADVEELVDRHASVDAILNTHSYGSYSTKAKERAKDLGVALFDMGELMGALNERLGDQFVNYKRKSPR